MTGDCLVVFLSNILFLFVVLGGLPGCVLRYLLVLLGSLLLIETLCIVHWGLVMGVKTD